MVYVYGFCKGNAVPVAVENQRLFTNHREYQPEECLRHCEIRVHLPPFALQPSARFIKMSMKKKAFFRWLSVVHVLVCEMYPYVWRTLHAEGMYPYNVQRVQYLESGDLAQRLEFCNWLNGNRRCVVTACLLAYRNSVATVSVIQLSCVVR